MMTAAGMKGDDAQTPLPPSDPFDLVEEYLLELLCSGKSWNSLIFSKKHFRFSTVCHRLCDSPISSFSGSVASASTTSLNHPLILNLKGVEILKSCDGIICFRIDASLALLFKSNFLPAPMKNHYTLVYDDRFSNIHKIIDPSVSYYYNKIGVIMVHTLGTDYQRKIPDLPLNRCNGMDGRGLPTPKSVDLSSDTGSLPTILFVSGKVNWLVHDAGSLPRAIPYFDMTAAACMKGDDAQTSLPPSPPSIPFDLMEEILCRLPVKYLLELRCVCKSWNSLISHDSNFAKKHLRFSTLCHDRHHLAVSPIYSPHEFYLCDSPISSFFSSVASTTSFTQLKHPAILNFEPKDLLERISTCDGIICFRLDASIALLINPSTRKANFSPPMKGNHNYYTLVYDRFSNNHKIIALSLHHQNKIGVNVHTLGTDYWRKIRDVPYNVSYPKPGIFVSDTVNWLADDIAGSPRAIVYFDLEKESCQEFLCPLSHDTSGPSISLGALKDCLCIFSRNEKFSDIWIMKEYGNEKSWTKLLRVPQIGDPYAYMHTKPLYIYEDDQLLLKVKLRKLDKFSLVVYDSKNDTFRIPEIQDNIRYFVSEGIYVDSLMSP